GEESRTGLRSHPLPPPRNVTLSFLIWGGDFPRTAPDPRPQPGDESFFLLRSGEKAIPLQPLLLDNLGDQVPALQDLVLGSVVIILVRPLRFGGRAIDIDRPGGLTLDEERGFSGVERDRCEEGKDRGENYGAEKHQDERATLFDHPPVVAQVGRFFSRQSLVQD